MIKPWPKSSFAAVVTAVVFLVFSSTALMAGKCSRDEGLNEIPGDVWVELQPANIFAVSETESSYDFQFYLGYSFAFESEFECEEKSNVLNGIFDPSFEFTNALKVDRISPYLISMDGEEVYIEAKYAGTFNNNFDFRLFPFDTQKFKIELVSFYAADELRFVQAKQDISDLDNFTVFGWVKGEYQHRSTIQNWNDETYQNLAYEITLYRQSASHSIRIFLPLFVIVVLNFVSLLMPTSRLDNKIGVQVSALIATAAYAVVLGRKLPDLPYLIVADAAISISFLLSALVLVYTMLRSRKTHG